MKTTKSDSLETPYAAAPGADDPRRGAAAEGPVNGPYDAPATEFIPGPYYAEAEERLPEVAERLAEPSGVEAKTSPFDRRDFMKLFGASTLATTAACVQRPVEKAIPYVQQPTDQWPGQAVHYATTCGECSAGCGVKVRTREGRPVKVEGLDDHPISGGKLCAVGQSTLQGLWHPERRSAPMSRQGDKLVAASWPDAYKQIGAKVAAGKKVGIFTGGSTGHRQPFLREFLAKVGSAADRLYTWDANTLVESITAAHQIAFGVRAIPRMDLDRASMIVGIGADFLDIGTSLVYNMRNYAAMHGYRDGKKGRHVQLEASFTLTGARADERHVIGPGMETLATLALVRALYENKLSKGSASARGQAQQILEQQAAAMAKAYDRDGGTGLSREDFDRLAEDLLAVPSVVLCGGSHSFDENGTNLQLLAILANELLGAYDNVLALQKGWLTPPVQVGDLRRFVAEAADLDVLIVIDADPVFATPPALGIEALLRKIPMVVSIQDFPNDTDRVAHWALPGNHYLESWGDEEPVAGFRSFRQPAVRTTTDSRQAEDILLHIAAESGHSVGPASYRDYLRNAWTPLQQVAGVAGDLDVFIDGVLRQGFVGQPASQAVGGVSSQVAAHFKYTDPARGGLRLVAPLDFRLRDGRHAHKPVLQETADALTTITWDTYVALNPGTAGRLGLKKYDVVRVEGRGGSFEGSVYPLPGLHPDVVLVPRGNGHARGESAIAGGNGVNPLVAVAAGSDPETGAPVTAGEMVTVKPTGAVAPLAQLQKHNDLANRKDIVRSVSLSTAAANGAKRRDLDDVPDLYPKLPETQYRWGMSIDLSRCTGCNACVVACDTENNIPQVGRDQIRLGRTMHWIKIDRYFAGSTDNPEVSFQPLLCQQCNHAPCEAVCPVYATTHEPEGINAVTYNRCIGTRYCANACPYKVRRFNWWTHRWNIVGERLQDRTPRALNPDVTVRTRGVIEKCTFCYQRVRDAKHRAKLAGTVVRDGDVKTACQQTCPAGAITFGNLNDTGSEAARARVDYRAYLMLGGEPEHGHYGIKTLPNVSYLMRVNLADGAAEGEAAGSSGHG